MPKQCLLVKHMAQWAPMNQTLYDNKTQEIHVEILMNKHEGEVKPLKVKEECISLHSSR